MTNGNVESRLDRIEQAIQTLVGAAQNHESRLTQTESLTQRNAVAIERLIESQQRMLEIQDLDRQRFDSTIASISAAVERIDRVMDYLMRRDGDRPNEG